MQREGCHDAGTLRRAQVALDAGWACGKEVDDDVRLDAAGMRQSIAWELALRNVKRREAAEAEALLRRETQCEAVRDVRVRHVVALKLGGLCALRTQAARGVHAGETGFAVSCVSLCAQPLQSCAVLSPVGLSRLCGCTADWMEYACRCWWSRCRQQKAGDQPGTC